MSGVRYEGDSKYYTDNKGFPVSMEIVNRAEKPEETEQDTTGSVAYQLDMLSENLDKLRINVVELYDRVIPYMDPKMRSNEIVPCDSPRVVENIPLISQKIQGLNNTVRIIEAAVCNIIRDSIL